jgi:hypothetical protein
MSYSVTVVEGAIPASDKGAWEVVLGGRLVGLAGGVFCGKSGRE